MQHLDYSPLRNKRGTTLASFRDLKEYSMPWRLGLGILLLTLLLGFSLIVGAAVSLAEHTPTWGDFAAMGAFLTLGGLIGVTDLTSVLRKDAVIKRFAERNGLSFAKDDIPSDYPGVYFDKGLVRISDRVRFPSSLFIEIGNFKLLAENQDRSVSGNAYGYVRVKLPKRLPNMLLASKSASQQLPIPSYLDDSQRLQLEGDFNNTFTLFVPKGYERDALYIFTPDVMAKFIDMFGAYSSEIVGDEIYFYSSGPLDLTKAKMYDEIIFLTTDLLQKFDKQISLYRDERVNPVSATVTASPAYRKDTIADSGRQLKESRPRMYFARIVVTAILALAVVGIIILIQRIANDPSAVDARSLRMLVSLAILLVISAVIGFIKILSARRTISKRRKDR